MCGMNDCNEWKTEKCHECTNKEKLLRIQIMMTAVRNVTSGVGLKKFQGTCLLLDRVYH